MGQRKFEVQSMEETTMPEFNNWMIDPNDADMLLIDHQSRLFQLVRDIDLPVLRSNVTALAKMARLAKIPTFTTALVPDGPNGAHPRNPPVQSRSGLHRANRPDQRLGQPRLGRGHREDQA